MCVIFVSYQPHLIFVPNQSFVSNQLYLNISIKLKNKTWITVIKSETGALWPTLEKQKGDIITSLRKIRILKEHCEQRYASILDKLNQMDIFSERHKLPKLTQEETSNMNIPILNF